MDVSGCLHLKSAVTQVGENQLLLNPAWVKKDDFPGMEFVEVDPSEPYAANAVMVGDAVIYPTAFPKTRARLQAAGLKLILVDASELAKAEGAVTCCSILFKKINGAGIFITFRIRWCNNESEFLPRPLP